MLCKIDAEEVSCIPAGVQISRFKVVTHNSHFFAYASHFSIYVYEISSNKFVQMITSSTGAPITTIRFSPDNIRQIAVAYMSGTVEILDIITQARIASFQSQNALISLCWTSKSHILFGFTKEDGKLCYFSPKIEAECNSMQIYIHTVRILNAVTIGDSMLFLCGFIDGSFGRLNFSKTTFKTLKCGQSLAAIDIDPYSPTNCLVAWRDGTIVLVDLQDEEPKEISKISSTGLSISGAAWLFNPPGHFLTTDEDKGVIRIWNVLSENQLETITVAESGFREVERLNSNLFLCSIKSGLIFIYDLDYKQIVWQSHAGHCNTIFGAEFFPFNHDVFLTCGAEGSICTWNTDLVKQIDRICIQNHNFYSFTLSPGAGFVVCGNEDGSIGVYSIRTLSRIYEYKLTNSPIISLTTSKFETNVVMVASSKGYCAKFDLEKKTILWTLDSSHLARGVAFSPYENHTFAIAGINKLIIGEDRNTYATASPNMALFNVIYSPYDKNVVLTSSDEGEIILWNISDKHSAKPKKLAAHHGPARAIAFHPTIDWLAASGGYDGTINLINIKTNKVTKFKAHHSHIYGICFSPRNPFLLITTSRDTSIKLWSLEGYLSKFRIEKLFNSEDFIFKPAEGSLRLAKLGNRIAHRSGQINFNQSDIVHIKDLIKITDKRAKKIISASPHETSMIKMALRSKDRLAESAKLELKRGNMKKYCELLFSIGEYDKALAAAPSVSVSFWRELFKERIKLLGDNNSVVNSLLLLGDYEEAINTCENNRNAFIIAASAKIQPSESKKESKKLKDPSLDFLCDDSIDDIYEEYMVASQAAGYYLKYGKVYLAAASFLSVGDAIQAISCLMRNGEVLTAIDLAFVLDLAKTRNHTIDDLIVMYLKVFDYSIESYKRLGDRASDFLHCKPCTDEISRDNFFEELSQPKPDQMTRIENDDLENNIRYLFIIGEIAEGLKKAMEFFRIELVKPAFDWAACKSLIKLIEQIPLEGTYKDLLIEINIVSLYLGAYEAAWKGYDAIIPEMISILEKLINTGHVNWIIKEINHLKLINKQNLISSIGVTISPIGCTNYTDKKYLLDDEISQIGKKEAMMWRDITSFSPIGSLKQLLYI